MTRIDTDRLYLRLLDESDCNAAYLSWLNDPEVCRFLETRHTSQTLTQIREFVAAVNQRDDEHLFGIFLRDGDRHIGNVKVGPIRPMHLVADVSLLIGEKDCWGKGYGTEAIVAVSRHAFEQLGVRKLAAGMYKLNQGSYRAFIKAGYQHEGDRRAHYVLDEERCDVLEVGLVPQKSR